MTQPDKYPISRDSGFWSKMHEQGGPGKTDIFRLREDLQRLEDLAKQASSCESIPEEITNELKAVQERVTKDFGTLSLVNHTLIELLIEKGVMTEDEFIDKMDEIDIRDGKRDGMIHPNS